MCLFAVARVLICFAKLGAFFFLFVWILFLAVGFSPSFSCNPAVVHQVEKKETHRQGEKKRRRETERDGEREVDPQTFGTFGSLRQHYCAIM